MTQHFDERTINPKTELEDIFPRSNRRQKVKLFQQALGFSVDILTMKDWLVMTIFVGFVVSVIAFCYSWHYAAIGLTFFTLLSWAASKFSKEFNVSTIGQLTKKISREHYSLARRDSGTINKNEIVKTIQEVFMADHSIDRIHLTEDASLGRP